jgi:hypothetical protein
VAIFLGNGALTIAALALVAGALARPGASNSATISGKGDSVVGHDRIVLTVPDGGFARTLTVVDTSGHQIAELPRWFNGDVLIPGPSHSRTSGWFIANGYSELNVYGKLERTRIRIPADGKTTVVPAIISQSPSDVIRDTGPKR